MAIINSVTTLVVFSIYIYYIHICLIRMDKVYTKRQYIPTMLDIFEFVVDLVGFRKEKTIRGFFYK